MLDTAVNGECPTCLVRLAIGETSYGERASDTDRPGPDELEQWFPDFSHISLLGSGGMGVVYRARHLTLGREVAIKTLSPALSSQPSFVDRFRREAKALAKLSHPNIVSIYDAGDVGGMMYLVMELVEGEDLHSKLGQSGPASVEEAIDWVVQTAHGLEYAHRNGIIHRDVKPANLLLDTAGKIKILDLGLAKFDETGEPETEETALTLTSQVLGSVDFMSPEQAEDTHAADARSDIYSLGSTLYFLLTGEPMYRNGAALKRILSHRTKDIPKLRQARSDIPPRLETVFETMVAKQPADRFQSMQEVVDALASLSQPETHQQDADQSKGAGSPVARLAATIALLGTVLLGIFLYRVQTNRGEIVASIDESVAEQIELKLKEGGIEVVDQRHEDKWLIKPNKVKELPAGDYRLQTPAGLSLLVSNDAGVEFNTDRFTIKRGDKIAVRIALEQPVSESESLSETNHSDDNDRLPKWSVDPNGGPLQVFPENEIWADVFSITTTRISRDENEIRLSGTEGHVSFDFGKMKQGLDREACVLRHFEKNPSYNAFYSSGGDSLVGFQRDGKKALTVARFDAASGELKQVFGHTDSRLLLPSPDAKTFFVINQNDDAILDIDTSSGSVKGEYALGGKELGGKKIRHADLSNNGSKLALSVGDQCAVFEVGSNKQIALGSARHPKFVFTSDSRSLLFFGNDGQVAVWDFEDGRVRGEHQVCDQPIRAVAMLNDNRRAIAASADGQAYLFEIDSGAIGATLICVNQMPEQSMEVLSLDLSDDDRWAVTGSNDRRCRLFRLPPAD